MRDCGKNKSSPWLRLNKVGLWSYKTFSSENPPLGVHPAPASLQPELVRQWSQSHKTGLEAKGIWVLLSLGIVVLARLVLHVPGTGLSPTQSRSYSGLQLLQGGWRTNPGNYWSSYPA